MEYFRVKLIVTFEEEYYPLLDNFIKEMKHEYVSVQRDVARRCSVLDYSDDYFKFDITKDFFEKQSKKKVAYLILDTGESKNLNEWVEYVFDLLQIDKNRELFNFQSGKAILRLCLNAQTDFDLFDIGLSANSLKLLSKLNAKIDIDFYHYLT